LVLDPNNENGGSNPIASFNLLNIDLYAFGNSNLDLYYISLFSSNADIKS